MMVAQTPPTVPPAVQALAERLHAEGHRFTFRIARLAFPGSWTAYCRCGTGVYASADGAVLAGAMPARPCLAARIEEGR